MELVLGVLCDGARPDPQGKMDLTGVFHDLFAPGFPALQDRLVLVLVVEWGESDHGRYQFHVDLLGDDGEPVTFQGRKVFEGRGHTDVATRDPDATPARSPIVMEAEDVVFPSPGRYRFRLRVKGRDVGGPSVTVVRTDAEPEPVAGGPETPAS